MYRIKLQVADKGIYTTVHTEEVKIAAENFICGGRYVNSHYVKNHLMPYFDLLHEYCLILIKTGKRSSSFHTRNKAMLTRLHHE